MLILSRRPTEAINFPQLRISVSIVSVKGNRVQVGIDAPPEIRVLRHELEPNSADRAEVFKGLAGSPQSPGLTARATHEFRNRLNKATLGLHLAQKQLEAGLVESADKSLTMALSRLAELENTVLPVSAPNDSASLGLESSAGDNRQPQQNGRNRVEKEKPQAIDVLLVEDDQNEQALLRGLLEMEGYQVHTAGNGHEALACLQRVTPRFVLLDMMMPECDGLETLQRIRHVPALQHVPIFAVSGSSPDSIGLSIGSDGVDDWFPKPLNAPRLVQHMRDRVAGLSV